MRLRGWGESGELGGTRRLPHCPRTHGSSVHGGSLSSARSTWYDKHSCPQKPWLSPHSGSESPLGAPQRLWVFLPSLTNSLTHLSVCPSYERRGEGSLALGDAVGTISWFCPHEAPIPWAPPGPGFSVMMETRCLVGGGGGTPAPLLPCVQAGQAPQAASGTRPELSLRSPAQTGHSLV